jgi:hypothetical protein
MSATNPIICLESKRLTMRLVTSGVGGETACAEFEAVGGVDGLAISATLCTVLPMF